MQPEKQANSQVIRLNVSLDVYELEFYFRLPFGLLNYLLAKHWLCLEPQVVLCAEKALEKPSFCSMTLSSIISDMPTISNSYFPLAQWNISSHKDLDFSFNSLHITPMDNILETNKFTNDHE